MLLHGAVFATQFLTPLYRFPAATVVSKTKILFSTSIFDYLFDISAAFHYKMLYDYELMVFISILQSAQRVLDKT